MNVDRFDEPLLIETLLTRGERTTMWLVGSLGVGAWKAGEWMEDGVAEDVVLFFGAAYALDVLMIVGFGYHFVTTSVRVYRRLWTRK